MYYAQSISIINFNEDDYFTRISQFPHKFIFPMTIQSCDGVAEVHYYTLKLQFSLVEPVYASCEKLFTHSLFLIQSRLCVDLHNSTAAAFRQSV